MRMPIKFVTFQEISFINTFTTNTTVEPFQGTTTRGSGLIKESNFQHPESFVGPKVRYISSFVDIYQLPF